MTRGASWKTPTLVVVLLAIAAFGFSSQRVPLLLVVWMFGAAGWWFTERPGGTAPPRWIIRSVVVCLIAWGAGRVWQRQLDVTVFCEFLTFVLLIKLWDRKRARDAAQLITLSLFLTIGAVLDNNSLFVGLIVLAQVPLTAWAAMRFQIGAGNERSAEDMDLARRTAGLPAAAWNAETLDRAASKRLTLITAAMTVGALGVAAVVFLFVPRGIAAARLGYIGQVRQEMRTGFTDQVELGRAGLLSESQRTVMEVRLFDGQAQPIGSMGEVFYFRGAELSHYQDGRWTKAAQRANAEGDRTNLVDFQVIRQEVDLRDAGSGGTLFALWYPSQVVSAEGPLDFSTSGRSWSGERARRGRLQYTVTSKVQTPPLRAVRRGATVSFPSEIVRAYAENVLRTAGVEPDPKVRAPSADASASRVLMSHLRGKFEYTTELNRPDGGRDPIEWFLTDERRGHCEYFASAMAAMCRSVGINARVIAGYVATEFDDSTGAYTVRESNAHAWVEAEVADGVWLTFDPTPPVDFARIHEGGRSWGRVLARWFDSVNDTWTTSVVMFDQKQQSGLFDLGRARGPVIDTITSRAAEDFRRKGPGTIVKYAVLTAMTIGAAFGAVFIAGRLVSDVARLIARRTPAGSAADDPQLRALLADAGFYGEMLGRLERAGMPKPVSVPPMQFAERLGENNPGAAAAVRGLSEIYYGVRFARRALSEADRSRADALLRELDASLVPVTSSLRA